MIEFQVKDRTVLVDDDQAHHANFYWMILPAGYVKCNRSRNGKKEAVYLHRAVLGLSKGDGCEADHINGNKLDNRRENLRLVNRTQNNANVKRTRANTTGFKGVSWCARDAVFRAYIKVQGKSKALGTFESAQDAHEFYCLAADMIHGEFANHG